MGLDPQVRKSPRRKAQQPTPVFLPGESHGQRSLGDYSLIGHTESETTGATEQSVAESKKKKKGEQSGL